MSFVLIQSPRFIRAARRHIKARSRTAAMIETALTQLADDPFQSALRSHPLKGLFRGSWACSAGYDLRIIFSLTKRDNRDAILLETVGTHDEVY